MVIRRLAWLRVLVTALLCVAGLARPVSTRWDDAGTQRLREPSHVGAPSMRAEAARLDERTEDTRDVGPALVEPPLSIGPACCRSAGMVAIEDRSSGLDRRGRPRARGPPTA
jgi:hypothetical protein